VRKFNVFSEHFEDSESRFLEKGAKHVSSFHNCAAFSSTSAFFFFLIT